MPSLLEVYRSIKLRLYFRRRFNSHQERYRRLIYGKKEITVISGPFRGLRYFNKIVWGSITPKWIGSYEDELTAVIEDIIQRPYSVVMDIGCAEGYYATGLAYRMPRSRIYAYDTDFISRHQTRQLAQLNTLTDRVFVRGFCSHEEISRHVDQPALIICDIEGFERELLNPDACGALKKMDILVEVHEGEGKWKPSTLDLLKSRFAGTHALTEINATDRESQANNFIESGTTNLNRDQVREAMNEHRSNGYLWLWMEVRQTG